MRKIVILTLSLLIIAGFTTVSNATSNISERPDIKVIIDGEMMVTGTPIIVNGRTLLPLRDLLINLGVENDEQHIIWNSAERSATAIKDSVKLYFKVGDTNAKINGQPVSIDAAPLNYNGKVYIPARFAAEAFLKIVIWDRDAKRIYIRDKAQFDETKSILDKALSLIDNAKCYKLNMFFENTIVDISGDSQKNTQYEQFYKDNNNTYSKTVWTISDNDQFIEENYKCNNQFMYSKSSDDFAWKKIILSTNYYGYININNPDNIFPKTDSFYASLLMETDQKNNLIHLKQDPYIISNMNEINFQSEVNKSYYCYDITINNQSGYITEILVREKLNADNIMLIDQSITYNYYDFNKSFNINLPNEIALDLQKTILPGKLSVSNEERNKIEDLKKSTTFESLDINIDKPRPIDSNTGILLCVLKDKKSLDTYNNLSDNAKIIFCNDNANDHRTDFNLCDGIHSIVVYDNMAYSDVVTGYDFLLENIMKFDGININTIVNSIKNGYFESNLQ